MSKAADAMAARAQAQALAEGLQGVLLDARRLAGAHPGAHGRRLAGPGEAFWQYRDHRPEDGARAVDWRRSARAERLFVREREWEAAQTAWLWLDPSAGMQQSETEERPSKRRRALTLLLAMALLAQRSGERIGALGLTPPLRGPHAAEQLGLALQQSPENLLAPPGRASLLVLASDFYAPIEHWERQLRRLSANTRGGVLLMLADPAEEDFPYEGRVLFREPGTRNENLVGRAEDVRAQFQQRLAAHRAALHALATRCGFALVRNRTDHPAAAALGAVIAGLEQAH